MAREIRCMGSLPTMTILKQLSKYCGTRIIEWRAGFYLTKKKKKTLWKKLLYKKKNRCGKTFYFQKKKEKKKRCLFFKQKKSHVRRFYLRKNNVQHEAAAVWVHAVPRFFSLCSLYCAPSLIKNPPAEPIVEKYLFCSCSYCFCVQKLTDIGDGGTQIVCDLLFVVTEIDIACYLSVEYRNRLLNINMFLNKH